MMNWYQFRSKDKKRKGIVLTRSKAEVARLAGYKVKDLVIEHVYWDGKEFVKEDESKRTMDTSYE